VTSAYGYINEMNRKDAKIAKEFFLSNRNPGETKKKQVSRGRRTIR